jgi:hypothetical protein
MAFEKLQHITASGRRGLPASVTLSGRGGRPALKIALSMEFAARANFSAGAKFNLLIGADSDSGVVRLERDKAGIIVSQAMGKGGLQFFCGHIERFGGEPQEKQFCAAEIVDTDTIEITLPPWAVE